MPDWKSAIMRRLSADVRAEVPEEIVEEIAQHLQDRYDELRAGGAPEAEAYRDALSELASASPTATHNTVR